MQLFNAMTKIRQKNFFIYVSNGWDLIINK